MESNETEETTQTEWSMLFIFGIAITLIMLETFDVISGPTPFDETSVSFFFYIKGADRLSRIYRPKV